MKKLMSSLSALLVRGFRVVRNLLIDLRFGMVLGAIYVTRRGHCNSDYRVLSKVFENRILESDVLVDIGCGLGRVMTWWHSHYPENQIIGIEIDEVIAWKTQKRLEKHQNVTVISGDVIENIPENGTIFYFFNPFEAEMVEAFKDRLASLFDPSQGIVLLYYNCKHLAVFANDPGWRVEAVDLGGARSAPFSKLGVITMT